MRGRGIGSAGEDDLVALCRAEHARLVRALDLVCGDLGRAEELAQEALVRLWQHWPRVRRLERPAAWLHRVAMNLAVSDHRRRGAERRALGRVASRALVDAQPGDDGADEGPVRAALARLPERQRIAIVLRYLLDLPVADVAEVLELSPGAVRALTFRAVEALRADLAFADPPFVPDVDLEESPYAR